MDEPSDLIRPPDSFGKRLAMMFRRYPIASTAYLITWGCLVAAIGGIPLLALSPELGTAMFAAGALGLPVVFCFSAGALVMAPILQLARNQPFGLADGLFHVVIGGGTVAGVVGAMYFIGSIA